jgi:hypothetical protein
MKAWVCSVCVVWAAATARADTVAPPAPGTPPNYVPLVIHGDRPGLSFGIVTLERPDVVWQRCVDPCTVYVPPGEYYVQVDSTDDTLEGRKKVEVTGPTQLELSPRSKSLRYIGLTLALGGTALSLYGLVQGIGNSIDATNYDSDSGPDYREKKDAANKRSDRWFLYGFAGGAVLSGIGWVLFAPTRPSIDQTSLGSKGSASNASAWSGVPLVGVAPMPGGAALSMAFAF